MCALSLCPTCSLVLKFPDMTSKEVCPQAFAKAHHRGHTYYDKLVRELKGGSVNGDRSMFNKHSALKPSVVKDIMKRNIFNMSLSTEQFTAATLPNTIRSLATASWMQQFFRLTGSIFIMFILSLWSSLFIYLIIMCFRWCYAQYWWAYTSGKATQVRDLGRVQGRFQTSRVWSFVLWQLLQNLANQLPACQDSCVQASIR